MNAVFKLYSSKNPDKKGSWFPQKCLVVELFSTLIIVNVTLKYYNYFRTVS